MTDEAMLEKLEATKVELTDIYDKHVKMLAAVGAPDYAIALMESERELVMAELSCRITDLFIKLHG